MLGGRDQVTVYYQNLSADENMRMIILIGGKKQEDDLYWRLLLFFSN